MGLIDFSIFQKTCPLTKNFNKVSYILFWSWNLLNKKWSKLFLSKSQINKILNHSISESRKYEFSEDVNHRPRQFFLVLSRLLSSVQCMLWHCSENHATFLGALIVAYFLLYKMPKHLQAGRYHFEKGNFEPMWNLHKVFHKHGPVCEKIISDID